MGDSGILLQVVKIKKTRKRTATHFAICNGCYLRYLIDLTGGKKRLRNSISTYSKKLELLMKWIRVLPFFFLQKVNLGYYVHVQLHPCIDNCKEHINKYNWNMIIGTYDERQKIVLQCFNKEGDSLFIKVGNAATEVEMATEISFLHKRNMYQLFHIPTLIGSKRRSDGYEFNIQITEDFHGDKVEPTLNEDVIKIYQEISKEKKSDLEFSHGDFAPWNLRKTKKDYVLFDWEHCGYRMKGFDLMHYAMIIETNIHKKEVSEAFDTGLANIQKYLPNFYIDKRNFLKEFQKLRTELDIRKEEK